MIKLSKLFLALSFMFALVSCSDDEQATDDDLTGTWKAISFTADIETTSDFGGVTSTVVSAIEGKNLDYELTFDETTFMTNGSYDVTYEVTFDGNDFPIDDQSVTDATGNGTYSTDANVMTISGSFFDFSVNGVDYSALNGEQMANYEINSNGELVFTQDEEMTDTQAAGTTTSKIVSQSVWMKQ